MVCQQLFPSMLTDKKAFAKWRCFVDESWRFVFCAPIFTNSFASIILVRVWWICVSKNKLLFAVEFKTKIKLAKCEEYHFRNFIKFTINDFIFVIVDRLQHSQKRYHKVTVDWHCPIEEAVFMLRLRNLKWKVPIINSDKVFKQKLFEEIFLTTIWQLWEYINICVWLKS